MKKFFALLLAAALLLGLCACDSDSGSSDATELSFKAATSFTELQKLNGQTVTICGYMATSSPVDGGYMFLMNLPDQSCPFCVPNSSQLSNTMAVYAKTGKSFKYTAQAIRITGTLVVADSEDKPFSDMYGYEFTYKIVDATYKELKSSELTSELKMWQKLADTTVVSDVYTMFDYLNFVCYWPTYFVNDYTDKNGDTQPGYYLYAADALYYLTTDGAQYNYGYVDGYFDSLIKEIESTKIDGIDSLADIVRDAKVLAERAAQALVNGEYTCEQQYVEKFGTYDYIYTLNDEAQITSDYEDIYNAFNDWFASLSF